MCRNANAGIYGDEKVEEHRRARRLPSGSWCQSRLLAGIAMSKKPDSLKFLSPLANVIAQWTGLVYPVNIGAYLESNGIL